MLQLHLELNLLHHRPVRAGVQTLYCWEAVHWVLLLG